MLLVEWHKSESYRHGRQTANSSMNYRSGQIDSQLAHEKDETGRHLITGLSSESLGADNLTLRI